MESLPTTRILLLVNYRPEYQHGWGSKTYYTQLRLDPLPPVSADELLQALLGDDASLQPLTQSPRQALPPPSGLRWLRKAAAASAGALGARQGAGRGRQSGQRGAVEKAV